MTPAGATIKRTILTRDEVDEIKVEELRKSY